MILLAVLGASASYIAVPAAMRAALPQADHGMSITASLGVTFPFNVIVGIPLYIALAEAFFASAPCPTGAVSPRLREHRPNDNIVIGCDAAVIDNSPFETDHKRSPCPNKNSNSFPRNANPPPLKSCSA